MLDLKSERSKESPKRFFRKVAGLIPNGLTVIAILFGLAALRLSGEHHFSAAMGAIFAAAVLDVADGFAARRLNAVSAFGSELDSLADFLNFGVAPALLLYQRDLTAFGWAGWLIAALYAVAAGLRLARFNILAGAPQIVSGPRKFRGLPTTAAAVGIVATAAAAGLLMPFDFQALTLAGTCLLLAALMVSDIEVPALTAMLRLERSA